MVMNHCISLSGYHLRMELMMERVFEGGGWMELGRLGVPGWEQEINL